MAHNDNQRVTSNNWVALGGASEECVPLHHVCTQEAQSLLLYKCGGQKRRVEKEKCAAVSQQPHTLNLKNLIL